MHIRSSVPGRRQCAGLAAVLFICLSTWIAPAARAADGEPVAASVTLTVVDAGESVAAGSDIVLRATLSGIASPRRARFFDGGRVIATDRMPPWEYKLRRIRAGTHPFRVEFVGAGSVVASSPIVTVVAVAAPANQPPSVAILSPASNASITQGTAVSLAAEAKDPDGSIARVEYWKGTTLLGTATNPPYQVVYAATTLGSASIVAKAFDNLGATASSVPVSFSVVLPPPSTTAADDAVRLLLQATFGPSRADVDRVRALGATAWLDEQFRLPVTHSHLGYLREVRTLTGRTPAGGARLRGDLAELPVRRRPVARARRVRAVGDHRDLEHRAGPEPVGAGVVDGHALSQRLRQLPDAARGRDAAPGDGLLPQHAGQRPRESGRGLPAERELRARGACSCSPSASSGSTPTARRRRDATGQTAADLRPVGGRGLRAGLHRLELRRQRHRVRRRVLLAADENWIDPMVRVAEAPLAGAKKLLDGGCCPRARRRRRTSTTRSTSSSTTRTSGRSSPRRLIQFLVTSNPSPGYVARVAARFNNNGSGVRGDLAAVVRAILTDPEARDPTLAAAPTFGKLREPVIRFTHLLRATGAKAANGRNSVWWLDSPEDGLGQSPLLAPSVFNFFSPFFARPGAIAAGRARRAGIPDPHRDAGRRQRQLPLGGARGTAASASRTPAGCRWISRRWTALAGDPAALVDQLNLVFTANSMSAATRATLVKAVNAIPAGQNRASACARR